MRASVWGLLVGIGVTCALMGTRSDRLGVYAQNPGRAAEADSIIALAAGQADGQQLIVLIDPLQQTLGSYHIDVKTGKVALRGVRNVRWDLKMDEFNGTEPSPEQIKVLLQSR